MKKLLLALALLFTVTTITAQEGFSISAVQNLDDRMITGIVEAKVETPKGFTVGFAGELSPGTNQQKFNAQIGQAFNIGPVGVTGSALIGSTINKSVNQHFYGLDATGSLKLIPTVALVAKVRYQSSFEDPNFTPRYFAGVKINL